MYERQVVEPELSGLEKLVGGIGKVIKTIGFYEFGGTCGKLIDDEIIKTDMKWYVKSALIAGCSIPILFFAFYTGIEAYNVAEILRDNEINPVILNNFVDVENYKTLACFAETQGLKVLSLFMEAVILHRG